MSDGEETLRRDALAQRIGALSLSEQFGEPDQYAAPLFGSRADRLKPSTHTISQGTKKRQFVRQDKYVQELEAIENAVGTREDEVIELPDPADIDTPVSPYSEALIWWQSQKQAFEGLGTLPKNTSGVLGNRRKSLRDTIEKRISELAALEGSWKEHKLVQERSRPQSDPRNRDPDSNAPEPGDEPYEVDCKFLHRHPILRLQPIAAYIIFVVAIVAILGKLPQAWSGILLSGLQRSFTLLLELYTFKGSSFEYIESIRKNIPKHIRQVQKRLQLRPPPSVMYACCPNNNCSKIYPPDTAGNWPEICTNTIPGGTEQCCRALLRSASNSTGSSTHMRQYPIRPFTLYDIKTQIAELVTLEPSASHLKRRAAEMIRSTESPTSIADIFDGQLVREFQGPVTGPNGTKQFFDHPDDEGRLMFSLSTDWFNPGGVKAAGPSISVGVMALCCVNLPISIRYKPENLILLGIIPGPREPALDTINYFLSPVVDDFLILWRKGLTLRNSPIRLVRAAILAIVTDMPASKKIAGNLSHHAHKFCSLCLLEKADIDNLEMENWPKRTCENDRKAAFDWLNATGPERRDLSRQSGIRWSEVYRLPYWDPTKQVVVDIMHNLFLGLIKKHYTIVLGMINSPNPPGGAHLYQEPKLNGVKAGRRILNLREQSSKSGSLTRGCSWADLYSLATECGLTLKSVRAQNSKKSMADDLDKWRLSMSARVLDLNAPIRQIDVPEIPTERCILDNDLILKIREAGRNMIVPTWLTKLPQTFGSASGGSLKADQWRIIATLYAPLVLIREWPKRDQPRSIKWLQCTTDLMSAIYACTSHTVSEDSIDHYETHILSYLRILKETFEGYKFVPNDHAALHVIELLRRLGPAHGWWTFPFERLIRELQNFPTNSRIGELEQTMANSFYLASRLRKFARANQFGAKTDALKDAIKDLITHTDSVIGSQVKGTLISDVFQATDASFERSFDAASEIDMDVFDTDDDSDEELSTSTFQSLRRLKYRGVVLSTVSFAPGNSNIYLKDSIGSADRQVYQIQQITQSHSDQDDAFLMVRKYKNATTSEDVYRNYPLLRAKIWSRELETEELRIAARDVRCHAAIWNITEELCVAIVLDRGTWE